MARKTKKKHVRKGHGIKYNWGKSKGTKMSKLTPRIKKMVASGMSIQDIAKKIGWSYSYTWVMARNYKWKENK